MNRCVLFLLLVLRCSTLWLLMDMELISYHLYELLWEISSKLLVFIYATCSRMHLPRNSSTACMYICMCVFVCVCV
jgi:hypothetical protein